MADTEIKNKNRRLAQNTMFLYMMTASTYILNFATVAYLTRVLGPSIYGQVGIAIGYMAYIQIVLDFGFILSATQRISERREDTYFASEVIAAVTAIKLVLFCLVCCIFIMLYRLSFFDDMVLKLVLQPIVENAVLHGIDQDGSGNINILGQNVRFSRYKKHVVKRKTFFTKFLIKSHSKSSSTVSIF